MEILTIMFELLKVVMMGLIVSLVYLSWQKPKPIPTYHLDKFCKKYDINCHEYKQ